MSEPRGPVYLTLPREVLADPGIDAVLICTATDTHAMVANILAAVVGRNGKSACQRRVDGNDVDDAKESVAAVRHAIGATHHLDAVDLAQREFALREVSALAIGRGAVRDPFED